VVHHSHRRALLPVMRTQPRGLSTSRARLHRAVRTRRACSSCDAVSRCSAMSLAATASRASWAVVSTHRILGEENGGFSSRRSGSGRRGSRTPHALDGAETVSRDRDRARGCTAMFSVDRSPTSKWCRMLPTAHGARSSAAR
jgi:hypothetical protein